MSFATLATFTPCYAFMDDLIILNDGAVPDYSHVIRAFARGLFSSTVAYNSIESGIWMCLKKAPLPEGWSALGIREIYGLLGEEAFIAVGTAWHLMNWRRGTAFCNYCGTALIDNPTERSRLCPLCAHCHYPIVSPAVIVAVTAGDKILLGHNKRFGGDMHSILAGFVEPGEALEDTVRREIFEEAGIAVKNIKYIASQPWPFPHSIMLGFEAQWESGQIRPDGEEIDRLGWFAHDELPNTPGEHSIAGKLIKSFVLRYNKKT